MNKTLIIFCLTISSYLCADIRVEHFFYRGSEDDIIIAQILRLQKTGVSAITAQSSTEFIRNIACDPTLGIFLAYDGSNLVGYLIPMVHGYKREDEDFRVVMHSFTYKGDPIEQFRHAIALQTSTLIKHPEQALILKSLFREYIMHLGARFNYVVTLVHQPVLDAVDRLMILGFVACEPWGLYSQGRLFILDLKKAAETLKISTAEEKREEKEGDAAGPAQSVSVHQAPISVAAGSSSLRRMISGELSILGLI